eukprot:m.44690 g.44690  ORF g.44690 m.44690 type:complete len:397 (-) comp12122_c0_seq5:1622-2812(-)
MLERMGWSKGVGLGKNNQGRTEPVPLNEKRDVFGIGRLEMETEIAAKTTEMRRLLDTEIEQTEELLQQKKAKAEKEETIKKELADMNKGFFCDVCNKGYTKMSEWDNHLSSYDHHHRKRLKELKQRDFSQKNAKSKKKERRNEEKALARLQEMAARARGTSSTDSNAAQLDTNISQQMPQAANLGFVRKSNTTASSGGFKAIGDEEEQKPAFRTGGFRTIGDEEDQKPAFRTGGFKAIGETEGSNVAKNTVSASQWKTSGFTSVADSPDDQQPTSFSSLQSTDDMGDTLEGPAVLPSRNKFKGINLSAFGEKREGMLRFRRGGFEQLTVKGIDVDESSLSSSCSSSIATTAIRKQPSSTQLPPQYQTVNLPSSPPPPPPPSLISHRLLPSTSSVLH